MNLFKNGVGRPSNDIKRKRRIIVFLLATIIVIPLISFVIININENNLKASVNKKEKLEVYAYTGLPSTPSYSIKDEKEKKKGNRTFNLQDFDIWGGYIYFSKQSRGSCTETDPKKCNNLLNQVTIYRVKYDSKNDSKFYEPKKLDKMVLRNSGHGTILNHISTKNKTYMITGISELDDNNGLRKWNSKYIGTSKYFGLVTYVKNRKTDVSKRDDSNKYKALINDNNDKKVLEGKDFKYSRYIYDIGVDEKNKMFSVRNDKNVYIYNYDFGKNGKIELGIPKYSIKVDSGSKQGHDIYNNNIFVLYNDKIMLYNYIKDTTKTFKLNKKDIETAVKNSANLDSKVTSYEFEGIKVYNDKIYVGCKVSLKEEKTRIYSFIFEFNPELN